MGATVTWQRNGKWAMQNGEWTICKSMVGGSPRYLLYRLKEIQGRYSTASDAQAAVIRLEGTATEETFCGANTTE